MKNLLGNLKGRQIIKEINDLDIRDNTNHERILILLYILMDMKRTKNRCLYNLCRNVDEAIGCWENVGRHLLLW